MTRTFKSLAEFGEFLQRCAGHMPEAKRRMLKEGAEIVKKRAQSLYGNGAGAGWPGLAASTLEDKARHGWPSPSPLLRSGAIRDSVESVVAGEREFSVGSNDLIDLFQELGTSRGIPPRPVMEPAMKLSQKPVEQEMARKFEHVFTGAK
ncbi:MAG TPA: hypothetical protein VFA12_20130 [Stellaceae bacterium]|nr:hypothetical protein [Stellaceae bacterium]